jgi:type IV pilus assembly protein PilY1
LVDSPQDTSDWVEVIDTGISSAYVGGITPFDWDNDFNTDMLYFGVVGTNPETTNGVTTNNGALMQTTLSYSSNQIEAGTPNKLIRGNDGDLPFGRAPLVIQNRSNGEFWVYAASGNFLVNSHLASANIGDNRIFGIRVNDNSDDASKPWITSGSSLGSLLELDNVSVHKRRTTSNVTYFEVSGLGDEYNRPNLVESYVRTHYSGWSRPLVDENELVFTSPTFYRSTLVVNSLIPTVTSCGTTEKSGQYYLNFYSGLPQTQTDTVYLLNNSGGIRSASVSDNDTGQLSLRSLFEGSLTGSETAGDNLLSVDGVGDFTNKLMESDSSTPARRSWREISIDELVY